MSQSSSINRVTRLAPSPTGALHLGNARTFLINWAIARQAGWKIVLRIEDLDSPRVRPGADQQAIDDLTWLGMNWDEHAGYQLTDLSPYQQALNHLAKRGLLYPCQCTRKEIQAAQSAPHAEDHDLRYPGTCRPAEPMTCTDRLLAEDATAWRVQVPDSLVTFDDQIHGRQQVNVRQQVGDFVVATKLGLPAYQLAVVVDDARHGVTDVIRGDDLLSSTARQILLWQMLELSPLPRWWHLPLVVGQDGRRLAKRHGDTRIAWYRQQQVAPQRIVGLLAKWAGLIKEPTPMTAAEFAQRFQLNRLPRLPVIFTPSDHDWLLG